MKKTLFSTLLLTSLMVFGANAANYVIDTQNAHASINFKVSHLGFSFVTGRFNKFSGTFSYDKNAPEQAKITVDIDTSSVDTNHAVRNKHLRSKKFLDVAKFPKAHFNSTKVEDKGNNQLRVTGDLTLHGVTKTIVIDGVKVGEGKDPWGGYRAGFTGSTQIMMKDFNFKSDFGAVQFDLVIEGIKQK